MVAPQIWHLQLERDGAFWGYVAVMRRPLGPGMAKVRLAEPNENVVAGGQH